MMSKMRSMASIQVPFPHTVNLRISVRALISNLVEDRGRLFEGNTYSRGRLFEGMLIRGGRLFEGGRLFNFSEIVA